MHIIYMNGGLGNQLFQFIFYCWYRNLMPQVDIVIDDGKFWGEDVPHHGYELQRIFGLNLPLLSQRFSKDVWEYMVHQRQHGVDIPEQLRVNGFPIKVIRENNITNIKFNGEMQEFSPGESLNINTNDNIYWHGHWLTDVFYNQASQELQYILDFPPFDDPLNIKLHERISLSQEPTAIHIRRGDMVNLGWAAPPAYYKKVIGDFEYIHKPSLYLLFSDDISWCEEYANELGLLDISDKLLVVDNNRDEDYWRDLQLMSLCKNRISDRSSFSLLAGLLCSNPQKQDVNNW